MAKKKEQQRSYMQVYIPDSSRKKYTSEQTLFYGLDRRENADTGTMSECSNIDVTRLPEIVSVKASGEYKDMGLSGATVKGVYGYGKSLFVVSVSRENVRLTRIDSPTFSAAITWDKTAWGIAEDMLSAKRELAVFCLYDAAENEMFYETEPTYYIMVYPDSVCVPIDFTSESSPKMIAPVGGKDTSPVFEHITVWNGRLFGARDNVVVCSRASTFRDFTLDTTEAEGGDDTTEAEGDDGITVGGYDPTHAWYSTTQANIQSNGNITAITAYDGHPIVFKDDYMHQINNNKNPFRFQDIVAVGCVSARSVCELDSVLYFASRDGIYRYNGGYPKKISEPLDFESFDGDTVCGAYNGVLYLYDKSLEAGTIFTYCPKNGMWASVDNPYSNEPVTSFAVNDIGIFAVYDNGKIYGILSESGYSANGWSVKTDYILSGSAGDKRVHSIKAVASGNDINITVSEDSLDYLVMKKDSLDGVDKVRALIRKTDSLFHRIKFSGSGEIHIQRVDVVYSYSGNRYK